MLFMFCSCVCFIVFDVIHFCLVCLLSIVRHPPPAKVSSCEPTCLDTSMLPVHADTSPPIGLLFCCRRRCRRNERKHTMNIDVDVNIEYLYQSTIGRWCVPNSITVAAWTQQHASWTIQARHAGRDHACRV